MSALIARVFAGWRYWRWPHFTESYAYHHWRRGEVARKWNMEWCEWHCVRPRCEATAKVRPASSRSPILRLGERVVEE